jgi:hypothetical protein
MSVYHKKGTPRYQSSGDKATEFATFAVIVMKQQDEYQRTQGSAFVLLDQEEELNQEAASLLNSFGIMGLHTQHTKPINVTYL